MKMLLSGNAWLMMPRIAVAVMTAASARASGMSGRDRRPEDDEKDDEGDGQVREESE